MANQNLKVYKFDKYPNISLNFNSPNKIIDFYGKYVNGVCCILGKNGSGKSNIAEEFIKQQNAYPVIYYAPSLNNRKIDIDDELFFDVSDHGIYGNSDLKNENDLYKLWYLFYFEDLKTDNIEKFNLKQLKQDISISVSKIDNNIQEYFEIIKNFKIEESVIKKIEDINIYYDNEREYQFRKTLVKLFFDHFLFPHKNNKIKLRNLIRSFDWTSELSFFELIESKVNKELPELSKIFKLLKDETEMSVIIKKEQGDFINAYLSLNRSNNNIYFTISISYKQSSPFQFSTGDANFLDFMGRTLYVIRMQTLLHKKNKNYILVFDEIDIALHPDRQKQLFNLILDHLNSFGQKNGVRFLILMTSHSPFIASDIPSQNLVYLELDTEGNTVQIHDINESFANNIHLILKDSFFLPTGSVGEFAAHKVKREIIDLLYKDKPSDNDTQESNSKERKLLISDDDKRILNHIKLIGEPLIKKKLLSDYTTLVENTKAENIKDQIEEFQKIIETLKSKLPK